MIGLSSTPQVSDSHGQWFRLGFGRRRLALGRAGRLMVEGVSLVALVPHVGGVCGPRLLPEANLQHGVPDFCTPVAPIIYLSNRKKRTRPERYLAYSANANFRKPPSLKQQ